MPFFDLKAITSSDIIQIILGGIIIWYTLETHLLRKQNFKQIEDGEKYHREQIEVLERQLRLGISPYIYPTIIPLSLVPPQNSLPKPLADQYRFWSKWIINRGCHFHAIIEVKNISNNLAVDISGCLYDHHQKRILISPVTLPFLRSGESGYLAIMDKPFSKDYLDGAGNIYYGFNSFSSLMDSGESEPASFVAIVFCDHEDNTYVVKQFFDPTDEHPSMIYFGKRIYLGKRRSDPDGKKATEYLFPVAAK